MNEKKETIKDILDGLLSKDSVDALAAIDSAEMIRIMLGHVASLIEAEVELEREAYCDLCKEKDATIDRLLVERDKAIKAPAPGNSAAMREALEQALAYCESDQRSGIAYSDNDVLVPILRAALLPRAGDEPSNGNGGRE